MRAVLGEISTAWNSMPAARSSPPSMSPLPRGGSSGRPVALPPLHIACSGLCVGGTREEWLAAVETNGSELRFFLGQLYDLFKKAPDLGSLINPARLIGGSMHADKLEPLLKLLDTAFAREDTAKRRSRRRNTSAA